MVTRRKKMTQPRIMPEIALSESLGEAFCGFGIEVEHEVEAPSVVDIELLPVELVFAT